jgi:H+/Cl- antiporter ClcA
LKTIGFVLIAGAIFGLAAGVFSRLTHLIETFHRKFIPYPPLRPFLGGLVLVFLYKLEGSYRFVGLGIEEIQKALNFPGTFKLPLYKTIFTSITAGSGFKGGELIPLVFIGTTLGSALSAILPVSYDLLAGLGFVAVFSGAANTPITCVVLSMEVFGYQIGMYSVFACLLSYYFSGHHGIYSSQSVGGRKHRLIKIFLSWLGELPKRFFKM